MMKKRAPILAGKVIINFKAVSQCGQAYILFPNVL